MKFEPRLAEKWERIDENTMRFYLRKGVKFHSGNPFTAKDIVWTLERLKRVRILKDCLSLSPVQWLLMTIPLILKPPSPMLCY